MGSTKGELYECGYRLSGSGAEIGRHTGGSQTLADQTGDVIHDDGTTDQTVEFRSHRVAEDPVPEAVIDDGNECVGDGLEFGIEGPDEIVDPTADDRGGPCPYPVRGIADAAAAQGFETVKEELVEVVDHRCCSRHPDSTNNSGAAAAGYADYAAVADQQACAAAVAPNTAGDSAIAAIAAVAGQ